MQNYLFNNELTKNGFRPILRKITLLCEYTNINFLNLKLPIKLHSTLFFSFHNNMTLEEIETKYFRNLTSKNIPTYLFMFLYFKLYFI